MSSITFDLLVGRNSTKHNFRKPPSLEWPIGDASANSQRFHDPIELRNRYTPDNFQRVLDNGYRKMGPIINQSRNIILRHFWKLLLEYTF